MFETLSTNHPIVVFFIAAMLGAFLGIRRQMVTKQANHKSFMGLRTMTLLSTMGAISTFFPEKMPYLPVIFFIGLIALITVVYANGALNLKRIGLTSELTAFIVFWIGVLVGWEQQILAILLTIFIAILNGFKVQLHNFASTLKPSEWTGALQLLVISGAVLPFLPREPIDPWNAIIPFNIWLLVILISGIGFLGYFLTKFFGARGGIPMTGFLGAIVSSTAVTTSMATQSKQSKLTGIFSVGILIAVATMQLRVVIEILLWGDGQISVSTILVPFVMAIVATLFSIYFLRITSKNHNLSAVKSDVKLESPFELMPALQFGLAFVVVLLALSLGKQYFGSSGIYMTSILSGFIDVDAIVLSTLESVRNGTMEVKTAETAISLAIFMNTLIKIVYVAILGSKKLIKKIAISLSIICLSGGLVLILT